MSGISDLKIIIGQGDSIKEVYNVRKQNLELNQPYISQEMEVKKREQKESIQESPKGDKIQIKHDENEEKQSPDNKEEKS